MRRTLLLIIALILCNAAYAASIDRVIPMHAEQGERIEVVLRVLDVPVGERFVLGEMLPDGAQLIDWEAAGASEIAFVQRGDELIWEFVALTDAPIITYRVALPPQGDAAGFDAVYAISPDVAGHVESSVQLVPPSPSGTPLPILPVEQSPSPVRDAAPQLVLAAFLLTIIGVLIALYLRHRVRQYNPHHVSFVDGIGGLAGNAFKYARLKLVPTPLPVVSARTAKVLAHVAEEQARAVEKIEEYERELPFGDVRRFEELERLKRELLSIRFAYEDV